VATLEIVLSGSLPLLITYVAMALVWRGFGHVLEGLGEIGGDLRDFAGVSSNGGAVEDYFAGLVELLGVGDHVLLA